MLAADVHACNRNNYYAVNVLWLYKISYLFGYLNVCDKTKTNNITFHITRVSVDVCCACESQGLQTCFDRCFDIVKNCVNAFKKELENAALQCSSDNTARGLSVQSRTLRLKLRIKTLRLGLRRYCGHVKWDMVNC